MKLKNKKTGEIINNNGISFAEGNYKTYSSLAEFNAEWEDYEEPEGWCVTMYGGISRITKDEDLIPDLKEIGNYFNDKESAYDALDKLKAWKRLKDKGFRFEGRDKPNYGEKFIIECRLPKETLVIDVAEDLDLLFGGEE